MADFFHLTKRSQGSTRIGACIHTLFLLQLNHIPLCGDAVFHLFIR